MDTQWTALGLEMVYLFLKNHSANFSILSREYDHDTGDDDEHDRVRDFSPEAMTPRRRRGAGIRHFKYTSNRDRWDTTVLEGQTFDPIQLMKALGPGLESIDSVHRAMTNPEDLETLDVTFLRILKIDLAVIPKEDSMFSRPEFLSRCRQLETLDLHSNSRDMFRWAVKEWNDNQKMNKVLNSNKVATASCAQEPYSIYPWIKRTTTTQSTAEMPIRIRPPVQLQHLQIVCQTDETAYDILRDAFYGFRKTLREVGVRSDIESIVAQGEWMDAKWISPPDHHSDLKDIKNGKHEAASVKALDDEECYNQFSSINSGSLLIQWPVPLLTVLRLSGPIAAAFDVRSLQSMPSLHTLSLKIVTGPLGFVTKGVFYPHGSKKHDDQILYGITALSYFSPKSLRRVKIAGPWPELSDQSLQTMINILPAYFHRTGGDDQAKTGRPPQGRYDEDDGEENEDDSSDDDDNDSHRWGQQLVEFSVLDNPRVTVPKMIQLARQMDRLEVMGMSLNLTDTAARRHEVFLEERADEWPRPYDSFGDQHIKEQMVIANDMVMKARLEMPWIDLGPEAHLFAARHSPRGYLGR
ncbi:hypothetical protein BGZ65_009927, partial [Modicella reniformis]